MPDKIVKTVETVITARDDSAAGIKSYEDRLKKMANDVPAYVTGKSANDQQQLDRMRKFYGEQAQEAEKLRQVNRTRDEQDIRDLQAKKIRAMREAARAGNIEAAANSRLGLLSGTEPDLSAIHRDAGMFNGAGKAAFNIGDISAAGAKAGEEGGKSFIRALNKQFGKGSDLAKWGKLLAGGGAIAGINILTEAVKEAAIAADKLVTQFKTGEISTAEMAGNIARQIPVMGGMIQMFDAEGKLLRNLAGLPSRDDLLGQRQDAIEKKRAEDEAFQKMRDNRDQGRSAILGKLTDLNQSEGYAAKTRGKSGPHAAIAQADAELNKKLIEMQELERQLPKLSLEQQEKAQQQIYALKVNYLADYKEAERKALHEFDTEQLKEAQDVEHAKANLRLASLQADAHDAAARAESLKRIDQAAERRQALIDAASKNAEASIAEIRQRLSQETGEIDAWLAEKEQYLKDPHAEDQAADRKRFAAESAKQQVDRANADRAKAMAQIDEDEKTRLRDLQNQRIEISEKLRNFQIDELKNSGNLSRADLKRLAVADQYLQKRRDLLAVANDERASNEQRQKARQMLDGLAGAEQHAEQMAIREPRRGIATATNAGMLHGLAEQAQAAANDPQSATAASTKEIARETRRLREIMTRMHQMLEAKNVNADRELIA